MRHILLMASAVTVQCSVSEEQLPHTVSALLFIITDVTISDFRTVG